MSRRFPAGHVPVAAVSVFTIVAAWSVGFAVGDALATPHPTAATIEHTEQRPEHVERDAFVWRGRIARGRAIEIKGVNGSIRAEAASGDEVEVTASKRWRRSDPAGVGIEAFEHEDGVTVCAVYPTPRGERPNTCEPGKGGHMNVNNNDVAVDFVVRVPRGVRLAAHTVNGNLNLGRLDAGVTATTVNGSIDLETRSNAEASTVNGSIHAVLGSRSWTEALRFSTVNGTITVALPSDANADLRARTMNGSVTTDFDISVTTRKRNRLTGTIGRGGGNLDLSAINGSIRILSDESR